MRDQVSLGWIMNLVANHVVGHLVGIDLAREAWIILEQIFSAHNYAQA